MAEMTQEPLCDLQSILVQSLTAKECNPYHTALWAWAFFSASTFIVSSLTKNYSQIDKLWSIIPFLYTWMTIVDKRTLLMAVLATIWGIRLTANFYRRGGYTWPLWSGEEDYRWTYVQKGQFHPILTHPTAWIIFNLVFISIFQSFLLMMIAMPSFVAYSIATDSSCTTSSSSKLNYLDGIATLLFVFFLIVEAKADNQQFEFQTEKYRQKNANVELKDEYADGFCQSGLFNIVRKPNYASEQGMWITFYLFSVAATDGTKWVNWSCMGFVLLVLLFQGSGKLTEDITIGKYPKYVEYQKRVPLYVPSIFRLVKWMKGRKGGGSYTALE